ncbi:MAG: GNAT family N-acetyltransferase [Candidatus Eremiobacteraeota bacterium]|nr:GNAT family N-acetyltransferase [Candidatus Eremiobacteraeota bacterium]
MPLTFRSARRDDVPAIVEIYARAHVELLHAPSAQQLDEWIRDERSGTFVVESDGRIDGFAFAISHDGWLVEIAQIVAREPGAGIGWFALREAVRHAFETSRAHRVYVEVVASNARARRLALGAGFALEGTWRDGYRREDGTYADLCAYGLLESDRRTGAA